MALSKAQIDKLASKSGVRRIGVENFLGTLGSMTRYEATQNLYADAASYKWNAATVAAIRKGIEMNDAHLRSA